MQSIFPRTELTRIQAWVQTEDGPSLRRYVMSVYFEPLQVYYRGCSAFDRRREPEEVVISFFERYLIDREGGVLQYLRDWLERGDVPLRKYLINGFWLSLRTERREAVREQQRRSDGGAASVLQSLAAPDREALNEFDRACVHSTVRYALELAEEACGERFAEHWSVFTRHALGQEPYETIAQDLGVSRERAAVMFRTGKRRFLEQLRGLVCQENASDEGFDQAIQDYMEIIQS